MKKSKIFALFTSFLLLASFNFGATNASASILDDINIVDDTSIVEGASILEDANTLEDTNISEDNTNQIEPFCLTCGGTTTKDYTVVATSREYDLWRDAHKPIINGGPEGGSKSFTVTESFSTTLSGSTDYDLASLVGTVGFSITYSKSFTETQSFTLKKNTKYRLMIRPNYLTQRVRYSVYNMGNGGKQTFKEYKYTTVKKPIGAEINIVEVK